MPTYHIDLDNGSDAATGADWANAWKTITNGATTVRIAPGDTIKISKTPDPTSIGNGLWRSTTETGGGFPTAKNITAMADNGSGAVRITCNGHGFVDDDIVQIVGLVTTGTTYETNGDWLITKIDNNTFDLQGSTYVNTRASGGTAQKINSKCVYLATAQTATVTTCNQIWTGVNSGVPAITLVATDAKKGGSCAQITAPASPATSTLYGYFAISSTDFSAYQKLTFWIKNEVAVLATHWKICLCSDNAGTTIVDTFEIPAIPSTGRWLPLTITKSGGGNLGNAIQSIALYSNSVAPTASKYLRMDNFEACTTSGLNLQSLISKNSAAYGGTEAWYGIQSIQGRIVILDTDTNTLANAGRGYWSATASETVTTYIRETFKTSYASTIIGVVSECFDSGSLGNVITYSGGWNTSTNLQDGDTFMDGSNGNGYGLQISAKTYITIERLEFSRYYSGIYMINGSNNIITTTNINNNSNSGISLTTNGNNTINVTNANNNFSYGTSVSTSSNNIITITNVNNNGNAGLYTTQGFYNTYTATNVNNNNNSGITFSYANDNTINVANTNNNASSGINQNAAINFLRGCTINETTEVSGFSAGTKSQLRSINHDNTAGNNWVFANYATANWQTSTKHDTEPGSWKCIISNSARNSAYTFGIGVPENGIYCRANKQVTYTAWVKKDHATNIACSLKVYADTVTGIAADVETTASNTTDWQQITLQFTPTNGGVVPVFFESWYVAGTSNTYIGAVSITQAP